MLVGKKMSITPARYRKVERNRLNMSETAQIPFAYSII